MRHNCKTFRRDAFVARINPAPVASVRRNRTQYADQAHAHPKITDKKIQHTFDKVVSVQHHASAMHNADLYQQSNSVQKRDALACLEKHASKIKWKKGSNRIIDIGCGDGSVTNMLKKYLPPDFKLLGCDVSESMVNYANEHHCNEQTSFTVLDIGGDLPEGMKGNFDNVFSFYTLHWIIDQERAFKNIYNLLDQDGECFMIFLACNPIYDVYRILAKNNKWSSVLQDVEKFISPYHDLQEPEKEIRQMMKNIGFTDIDVECKEMAFMYDDMHAIRQAVIAVNPFHIPKDLCDEFLEDYVEVLKEIRIVDKVNNNDSQVKFSYNLLVVYGRKPSEEERLGLLA